MRRRSPIPFLLAALLLVSTSPMAAAQGAVPTQPGLPGRPPTPGDSQTADRVLREAYGDVDEIYTGPGGEVYSLLSDSANNVTNFVLPRPLVVYRDGAGRTGAGPDAAFTYGPPKTFGNAPWVQSTAAARTGSFGYQVATDEGGRYPLASSGMFLTNAIDLATGAAPSGNPILLNPVLGAVGGNPGAFLMAVGNASGAVYSSILGNLEAQLTFAARHNLAAARDGVGLMLFTGARPPTTMPASYAACTGSCVPITPTTGNLGTSMALGANSQGFVGAQGWTTYTVDLKRWIGQTVWIGFYFASMPASNVAYFEGASFSQQAGFYGFQLDDLLVQAAGAYQNIQVRPLSEPSYLPLNTNVPTLAPGEPIPVVTQVRNAGIFPERVLVNVSIGATVRSLGPIDMPPGAVLLVNQTFDAMPAGTQASATVRVVRAADGDPTQNPTGARTVLGASDPGDAVPADDARSQSFTVRRVSAVVPGPLAREAAQVRLGDELSFTMPVQNLGNVPESFTLEATVVDVRDPAHPIPVSDLLPPAQVRQTVSLGLLESAVLRWDLQGSAPGHYRLFVRDVRDAPFEADDLVHASLMPILVPFVAPAAGLMAMDGAIGPGETAWGSALRLAALPMRDPLSHIGVATSTADVRLFHDGANLYVFAVGGAGTVNLTALFDDGADGKATDGGEDGLNILAATTGLPPRQVSVTRDLHYQASNASFVADTVQDAAGAVSVIAASTTFEFSRPLKSARPDDLQATTGGRIGLFLRMNGTAGGNPFDRHFPVGAEFIDGGLTPRRLGSHGLGAPDGSLDNELSGWWPLRLMPQPVVDLEATHLPLRVLSSGVGVERGAPPLMLESLADCDLGRGWTQQNIVSRIGGGAWSQRFLNEPHTEKWNCGPTQAGGRDLLFMGLAQDNATVCNGTRCPPHAILGTQSNVVNPVAAAILTTPAVQIGEAQEPWLVLDHQVSNLVWICDSQYSRSSNFDSGVCPASRVGSIDARSVARVVMDYWNPTTGTWTNPVILIPDGGYSSEQSTGIADPAQYGTAGRNWFVGGSGSACGNQRVAPSLPMTSCGWWDPTGFIPSYRPQGDTIASGGAFEGSPWRTDRIPLFGTHGPTASTPVDVRGQTVRFNFVYVRPDYEPPLDTPGRPPFDLGWRIGTIAVLEAQRFQRDVGVTDIRVGTTRFDPLELGVGPGTDLSVNVTVRNEGWETARDLAVTVMAIDPLAPADAAPLCASPERPIPGVLLAGAEARLTVPCTIPDEPGKNVRLVAQVTARGGDEFPPNNRLAARDTYVIRHSPDVAVVVTASPQVASESAVRSLAIAVENRGNVPVSGIKVSSLVYERTGTQGDPLGESAKSWTLSGTLGIGEQRRIESSSLLATPAVVPLRDLTFDPPGPGLFDIEVRAHLPKDAVAHNDVDQVSLRALQELYGETFDGPATMAAGVVDGSWEPTGTPGVWSVGSESDRHGRHLVAGDLESGEVPANADGSIVLPPFDLTTLRGATLAFNHRFDLEPQFDAGRVEASTDGGATWVPLQPRPQPLGGLPDGYSGLEVFGPNPFTGGAASATAVAFTGRSSDLPGAASDGYLPAEFNLAGHPDLRQRSGIDRLRFEGFAPNPLSQPQLGAGGQDLQFRHPSWVLGEPGAEAAQRYWWIGNGTLEPTPRSGETMWWSGSGGETSPAHPQRNVCPALETTLDLTAIPQRPGQVLELTWWDWRSGWQDGEGRRGTGGESTVQVRRPDTDGDQLGDGFERSLGTSPTMPDTDGDGWLDGVEWFLGTRVPLSRANPLNNAARPVDSPTSPDGLDDQWEAWFGQDPLGGPSAAQQAMTAEADHDQDGVPNLQELARYTNPFLPDTDGDGLADAQEALLGTDPRDPVAVTIVEERPDGWTRRKVDLAPYIGERIDVWFSYVSRATPATPQAYLQTNAGWFLDDVSATAWVEDLTSGLRSDPLPILAFQDQERIDLDPATGRAGPWRPLVTMPEACSADTWSLASAGAARRPGGWHVEPGVQVPGEGRTSVWRFSADNEQGYPHLADSRLVTPLVDLSQVEGESATLRFSHRHGFEAERKSPAGDAAGAFLSATDGGNVEFQVFDEIRGEFGPWQQLFRGFRNAPDRILLNATTVGGVRVLPDRLTQDTPMAGVVANRDRLATTGYNAIEERGANQNLRVSPRMGGLMTQPVPTEVGHGYSFEQFPGLMRTPQGDWVDYPVSYLFSGSSTGVDGWRDEAWDITPLIGERVRFAFHAQSNPFFADPDGTGRLHGWSIAGVQVEGEVFQGKPVLLRLRASTDGSITDGSWDVDDLRLVGTSFTRNLAITAGERDILALPRSTVSLDAQVANLGNTGRPGLAIAVRVLDEDKKPFQDVTVSLPGRAATPVTGSLPNGFAAATVLGPLTLAPSGSDGDRLPVRIDVDLPGGASRLAVTLTVLEQVGVGYRVPDNQVGGGIETSWTVSGAVREDLRLVRPDQDRDAFVVVSPGSPQPGEKELQFTAALSNNGTTRPAVTARWTVVQVLQKGPSEEIAKDWSSRRDESVGVLAPGQTLPSTHKVTTPPPRAGLYRATVAFEADGDVVRTAQVEFLVGPGGTYYAVDFATQEAAAAGWRDQSPPTTSSGGGSPQELQWRSSEGRFIWGVTPGQVQAGMTYCTTPNAQCNTPNGQFSQTIPSYTGMEGVGVSPLIDLTRVPAGVAFLTLQHGHGFEANDGGRVEVMPVQRPVDPANPRPAITCNTQPAWFLLVPEAPGTYGGQARSLAGRSQAPVPPASTGWTMPHRVNPLSPGFASAAPVVGGAPVAQETLQFDLSKPAQSLCPGVPDADLANETILVRLHVGTRPGAIGGTPSGSVGPPGPNDIRQGALGWQVDALRVSSSSLDMQPARRAVPIVDGATKQFTLEVTNEGPVQDAVLLRLDESASSVLDAAWVDLPQQPIVLDPGERRTVPFTVAVPADAGAARGSYAAVIEASSTRDPGVRRQARFDLVLASNPLPDLALQLAIDIEGAPPSFEAGSIAPVHATVFNVGQVSSRGTSLLLRAVGSETGYDRVIGSVQLPPLCPMTECGRAGATSAATFEWTVPEETGLYDIIAEVDPEGRVLESQRDNNVRLLVTRAVPLLRADLEVTSLRVLGTAADGIAEQGSLVQVVANVTNSGNAPAEGAIVRLLAGSSQLSETVVPVLNPGDTRSFSAYRSVAKGEVVVSAVALLPSGLETQVENNVVSRLLQVRGHDLALALPPGAITVEPEASHQVAVTVHNRGNSVERVLLSLAGANATGWGLGVQPNPVLVAPNGSAIAVLTLRAPADAVHGSNRLTLVARPASQPNVQWNATLPVTVPLRAGAPALQAVNATVEPGEARVPFVLSSRSNQAQRLLVGLRAPSWNATPLALELAPGALARGNLSVDIPTTTPAGVHAMELVVHNATGAALVASRAVVRVAERPEVSTQWVRATQGPESLGARHLDYGLQVRNMGNVPVRLQVVPRDLAEGRHAGAVSLPGTLLPGASTVVPIAVAVSADAPDGPTGRIDLWVTALGAAGNATRLAATLDLPDPGAAPNLVLQRLEVLPRSGAVAGQALHLLVRVSNEGAAASPATTLSAYANGVLVRDVEVPPLEPGAAADLKVALHAAEAGTQLVTVLADGLHGVREASEDDNGASLEVAVGKGGLDDRVRQVPAPTPLLLLALLAVATLAARGARGPRQ